MCGFFGMVGTKSEKALESLCLIKHRGPDALDYYEEDELFLGHVRLSIIDLDIRSNQPMVYIDRYVIVYNGEIYNYKELKLELILEGYHFKTESDTEVLLALYDLMGGKMLEKLDGMFAFAIWDKEEKKLFCARDRFGEKPFYYRVEENKLSFSSEIKSILKYAGIWHYNKDAINLFLTAQRHINEPETFFEEIFSLLPGHFLVKEYKKPILINKYYDIAERVDINSERKISYKDACNEFEYMFLTSVKKRLNSEVEVGTSLSGGLDSSAIVGVAKEFNGNIKTYSAINPGAIYDESKWINKVTLFNNTKSFFIQPNFDEYISKGIEIAFHHEAPLLSSSNYLQWSVIEFAKKNGTTVLIDGQGADEYLGGYKDFKYYAIWDLYNKRKLKQYIEEVKCFNEVYGNEEHFGKMHLMDPVFRLFNYKRKELFVASNFKERMIYSLKSELPHLLRYADRNSMAHSVEIRLPFLYHELIEFTLSLPSDYIYNKATTKRIMRDALKEYLPPEIYMRKDKIGFVGPKEEWLNDIHFIDLQNEVNNYFIANGFKISSDSWINLSLFFFLKAFNEF